MTATRWLLWIEVRRSVGLWAFPVLVGLAWLAWFIRKEESGDMVMLWPRASVDIGFAVAFLGPAAGGLAAWEAGRDRRRGLAELLATTPRPPAGREIGLLTATALWTLLAYVLAATCLGILTAREATWGGPVAPPILIAMVAIVVEAAIGYAVGTFANSSRSSRLTAALVPVALFFAQLAPTQIVDEAQIGPQTFASTTPYENLSPVAVVENVGGSIFWSPRLEVAWAAAIWLFGLGGLAMAILALRRRRRSPGAWGALVAAALAIVVGWSLLVPEPVPSSASPATAAIAYEPVCARRSITICLHPAYEAVLDETADLVDPIIRPLAGLPGFPGRAEQPRPPRDDDPVAIWASGAATQDALPIWPPCADVPAWKAATAVAVSAVQVPSDIPFDLTPAQSAVAVWLLRQADWGPTTGFEIGTCISSGGTTSAERTIDPAALIAADRFAALSPEEQRAWLEVNLAPLRAGELTLEDLP